VSGETKFITELVFNLTAFTDTGITISDTSKPDTAQISHTYNALQKGTLSSDRLYTGQTYIYIRRFAFKTTFSATNSDSADHTLNYEIYVDGSLATSGSFTVPANGSATQTEVYAQVPGDDSATIEIYMWADAANYITVDVTTDCGVGSESTDEQEVIQILLGGDVAIYASFDATGTASYTWTLRSYYSDVRIAYYTNDDLVFVAPAPYLKLTLYSDTSNEIARVKAITIMARPW